MCETDYREFIVEQFLAKIKKDLKEEILEEVKEALFEELKEELFDEVKEEILSDLYGEDSLGLPVKESLPCLDFPTAEVGRAFLQTALEAEGFLFQDTENGNCSIFIVETPAGRGKIIIHVHISRVNHTFAGRGTFTVTKLDEERPYPTWYAFAATGWDDFYLFKKEELIEMHKDNPQRIKKSTGINLAFRRRQGRSLQQRIEELKCATE